MSHYLSTHALERAIHQVSHGALTSLEARRAALGYDALQELDLQYQVPIAGIASSGAGWTKLGIGFGVEFVFAPQQRDSPFTVPHFTYGAVVQGEPSPVGATADPSNPDSLVAVSCIVVDWARDPSRAIVNGALVGIGVTTVGGQDVAYDGYVHLIFQGYGAPAETVPQLDVGR